MKFLSEAAWKVIEGTIADQRATIAKDRERIDRLMEAIGRKEYVPLVLPAANATYQTTQPQQEIEQSSGWWDTRQPKAPTPPKTGGKSQ